MVRVGCPQRSPCSTLLLGALTATLLSLCAPAGANVVPETCMYFNVVPGGWWGCQQTVWSCDDMTASTPAQGLVEFQIFVQRTGPDPVTRIWDYLDWPDSWVLIDGSVCRGGQGTLENHILDVTFPCTTVTGLWMAVDLVFYVQGYGKLDFDGTCDLLIGCSPGSWETTYAQFAEAGTGCEYTNEPCVCDEGYYCIPEFAQTEYRVYSRPGEAKNLEIPFTGGWCTPYQVHTGEAWCSGYVREGQHGGEFFLVLTADATGLGEGEYRSWVQVAWGSPNQVLARCIELIFEVSEPAGVEVPEEPAVSRVTWGELRTLYR